MVRSEDRHKLWLARKGEINPEIRFAYFAVLESVFIRG